MNKEVSWVVLPIMNIVVAILSLILGIKDVNKGETFSIWFVTSLLWFVTSLIYIFSHYRYKNGKSDNEKFDNKE